MQPPNILFILTDQLRFDSLGVYGCKVVKTPNIDRLASQGIRFECCYANNPLCTPSRASIWTGKPLPQHGVYRNHDILEETEKLIPYYLKQKNYDTALFGKLHVSGRSHESAERHPGDGFDVFQCSLSPYLFNGLYKSYGDWVKRRNPAFFRHLQENTTRSGYIPADLHFTRWATEQASAFITTSNGKRPFFCCVSIFDPHDPYDDHPHEMLERVNEDALDAMFPPEGVPFQCPEAVQREHECGYLGDVGKYTQEQLMNMRRSYFASIAFLDDEIGKLLDQLEHSNLMDDTIVLFTSDHGEMLGQKGLLGKGAYFYDPSVRVPLIIKPQHGIPGGEVSNFLAQPTDFAATFCRAGGFSSEWITEEFPDSCDLLNTNHGVKKERSFVACLYRNSGITTNKLYWDPPIYATMIRNCQYKLNLYHKTKDTLRNPSGELFDLNKDPKETVNLWNHDEYESVVRHMLQELTDWLVDQDCRSNMARGGSKFPIPAEWVANNPIRT